LRFYSFWNRSTGFDLMTKGAVRGLLVLFSASALIGASWSPLRAPSSSMFKETDRYGSPVVFVSLSNQNLKKIDRTYIPLPALNRLKTNIAIRSSGSAPIEPAAKSLPHLTVPDSFHNTNSINGFRGMFGLNKAII